MKLHETNQCWVEGCTDVPERGKGLCGAHLSCEILDVRPRQIQCDVVGCDKWLRNEGGSLVEAPEWEEFKFWVETVGMREVMDQDLVAGNAKRVGTTPWGDSIYQYLTDDLDVT